MGETLANVTIQVTDQYIYVPLFIMPYKKLQTLNPSGRNKHIFLTTGWQPTYFNVPVVAERGCRSARLVLSRLNSSPCVVSSLSLESLLTVLSLGERTLLRSLIKEAPDVGVARRMGVKSLK